MGSSKLSNLGSILFVDDDEEFRADFANFLATKSLPVIQMPSAIHACKFIQNQPWSWCPSIIITDIVMNGMGGYEFIRRIEEMYPNKTIPTIVISKLNSELDIIEAESAGAIAYITKPMDNEEIYLAIVNVLNNSRKRMQLFSNKIKVKF